MTITVKAKYYGSGTIFYEARSDDAPDMHGTGSTPGEAEADLFELWREEYHPDRTPIRLYEAEAEFQQKHVRES